MGKYENTLKQVQLRNLLSEKKYDKALVMAEDMLSNSKISDVAEIKLYAEIFKKCKKYDKAKELYYKIYDEIHTRRILFNLILLCIKSGSIQEAETLFEEYIIKDKDGIDRYIIRYRIDKAKGAARDTIIEDLIAIKNCEYMEEWAYELAKQYHKADRIEECVEECRQIILWFGEGEIVERAKLLKMHHEGNVSEDVMSNLQQYISRDISNYLNSEDNSSDNDVLEEEYKTKIQLPEESELIAAGATQKNIETGTQVEEAIGADVAQIMEEAKMAEEEIKVAEKEISESVSKELETSTYSKAIDYSAENELMSNPEAFNKGRLTFVIVTKNGESVTSTVSLISKILNKLDRLKNPKIARIDAASLNALNLEEQTANLLGSCMLIEHASLMSMKTINSIIKLIDAHPEEMAIILADKEEDMSKMLFKEEILKNQIEHFIVCG